MTRIFKREALACGIKSIHTCFSESIQNKFENTRSMKQKLLFFIVFLFPFFVYAQQPAEVKGNVISSVTGKPVAGVIVTLRGQDRQTRTDSKGLFSFQKVAVGKDLSLIHI